MPKVVLRYLHGTPEEVSSGRSSRSCSNIDNPAVREVLLTPLKNPDAVFVLGAVQEYQYPFIPSESEKDLKKLEENIHAYTQEALLTYANTKDPYHPSLISLVYHPKRIALHDLQQRLPNDPLKRIALISSSALPKYTSKEMVENPDLSSYALYISGARRPGKEALQQLEQLYVDGERFGLTRVEALQRIALEQCTTTPSEAFIRARASFIHIFESLNMLSRVEQELRNRTQALASV